MDVIAHYKMNDNLDTDVIIDDTGVHNGAVKDAGGTATSAFHSTDGLTNFAQVFDGTDDYIDIGNTASDVKSIAICCKPDSVAGTDYLIDLNGTDYVTIETGTVTLNGFAAGTKVIYVNGVVGATVTAAWVFILITSTTGFTADDLDIGRESVGGFFTGTIDNVILFEDVLDIDDAKILHSAGHGTEIIADLDDARRIKRRPIWQR